MSSSEAAIIAGASAIGGGVIVAISNFAISWFQAREGHKAELQRALIELWYVLSRIDHLLRMEPEGGKTVRIVNWQMSSRLPVIDHAIGLVRRRLLEPHLDGFAVEVNKALATATLLAPLKLLPVMSALTDVMGSVNQHDPEWQRKWNKARTDYFVECRDLLGSGVVRADPTASERPSATGQG